jgi:hypothetical protein
MISTRNVTITQFLLLQVNVLPARKFGIYCSFGLSPERGWEHRHPVYEQGTTFSQGVISSLFSAAVGQFKAAKT